jgi:anti-anti-sigma factor
LVEPNVSSRRLADAPDCCPTCRKTVSIEPSEQTKDAPCPYCRSVLWFLRKTEGKAVILTFLPGLVTGGECGERVNDVADAIGACPCVVLNLGHLRFVTSMFLSLLVRLHKRVATARGALRLCGLHPDVSEVFRLTRLNTVFDIFPDELSALAGS